MTHILMLSLDFIDNIIRTIPITFIQILFGISLINKNIKFIYYIFYTETIAYGSNYLMKNIFKYTFFGPRPENHGYINSLGQSTGCGIYPLYENNYKNSSIIKIYPGFPSCHTETTSYIITLLALDYELELSKISLIGLLFILNILILERILVKCHTIFQSISGAIIGTLLAYLTTHSISGIQSCYLKYKIKKINVFTYFPNNSLEENLI